MGHMTNQRILSCLGNQSAPPSIYGGRRVLFRCSICTFPWLMDGPTTRQRLSAEDLAPLLRELGASSEHLPAATCRLCAMTRGGSFEIDEYAEGQAGYGWNWEAANPPGAHLLATVLSHRWLCRNQDLPQPDVILQPARARAVLVWLSQLPSVPTCFHVLSRAESAQIAQGNPPGHGATGTTGWRWKGAGSLLACPPLGGDAIVMLAIALPASEPLDQQRLWQTWRRLAAIAATAKIAGEPER